MSTSYSCLSDVSSDDDDDYFDVQSIPHPDTFSDIPAVIAANYQSFEYGDFSTHPTFPLNLSNNAQPESIPKFFPNSQWTKDYFLRVSFSSGYHVFSVTTATLLNEIDVYTLRQHVEAYDRELSREQDINGKIAAARLRQDFFECGIDSSSFYIGLKRALKHLSYDLIVVPHIPVPNH